MECLQSWFNNGLNNNELIIGCSGRFNLSDRHLNRYDSPSCKSIGARVNIAWNLMCTLAYYVGAITVSDACQSTRVCV